MDYKPIQFPKSFSIQIINAHNAKMIEQHQSLKMLSLNSIIETYTADLHALDLEIQRIFGEEYISGVLEKHFNVALSECTELKLNVRVSLNTKKAILLNDKIDFTSEQKSNDNGTTSMDISENTSASDQFLIGPLTQLTPTTDPQLLSPPSKKRGPHQFMTENDQQTEMMKAIQQIAEQVSNLQLKVDNQSKNATGPRQAQGRWTGGRNDGLQNSRRGRSRSRSSNSKNSNKSWNSKNYLNYPNNQRQGQHHSRSYTRQNDQPGQFNFNSRTTNKSNRSQCPQYSRSQYGRGYERTRGRFQGRGNRGPKH